MNGEPCQACWEVLAATRARKGFVFQLAARASTAHGLRAYPYLRASGASGPIPVQDLDRDWRSKIGIDGKGHGGVLNGVVGSEQLQTAIDEDHRRRRIQRDIVQRVGRPRSDKCIGIRIHVSGTPKRGLNRVLDANYAVLRNSGGRGRLQK